MRTSTVPSSVLLLFIAALATPTPAQSGPWVDGEIIVRSVLPASNTEALYRIAPETGHGELLISGFYWLGWAGSMIYDPYRDGLLCNMGLPPDNLQLAKLWLVSHDGSAVAIPGFTGQTVRALAPIGDGRIYYQRNGYLDPAHIRYLDANNVDHVLMDQTGTAPLVFRAEHMLYHAPTNSLLATTSAGWSPTNLCVPLQSSIFRIPLSVDGTQVAGPIACGTIGAYNEIMALDYLPGGDVLLTLAGGQFFNDTLLSLDPITLAPALWAQPAPSDINGGFWSARIGRAVILDDVANVLRAYLPGQTGGGQVIASDVIVSPTTTGFSPFESMVELDMNGPGCIGTAIPFGVGLAGTGGVVPTLGVAGCPDVGKAFSLAIDNVVGAAPGGIAVGLTPALTPFLGGVFYVGGVLNVVPATVGGVPNGAGAGSFNLPLFFSDPAVSGATVYLQAGFVDAGAPLGASLTNALLLSIG